MKLVLMEPTRPGPGNPAISSGLLSLIGPSFLEMVEFISVLSYLPPRGPTRSLSTAELTADWPYFGCRLPLCTLFLCLLCTNNDVLTFKIDNCFSLLKRFQGACTDTTLDSLIANFPSSR